MQHLNQKGFTFNELLSAIAFVTFAILSYSLSSGQLFRQQLVADHSTVGMHLAHDKMEQLQGQRPLPDGENCSAGGEQRLSSKAGSTGIFSRCWRVGPSEIATDLKRIDVVVSWRDHHTHEVKLSTLIYTGD